ncbi:MAG: sugar transferase, partial [Bacteroidota bacterium]
MQGTGACASPMMDKTVYRQLFKPLLDRMVALILVIFFSPILLITAVSLAIANKGRVWFIQQRPGLSAKPFKVIKFRTMNDARDSTGNLLPDAERLTRLGKWIRRSSVDELPQLLN